MLPSPLHSHAPYCFCSIAPDCEDKGFLWEADTKERKQKPLAYLRRTGLIECVTKNYVPIIAIFNVSRTSQPEEGGLRMNQCRLA